MKIIKYLFVSASIFLGFRNKQQEPCRQIFLSDGRKVNAPLKPQKLRVQYSIVHEESLAYPTWFEYIRKFPIDEDDEGAKLVKKWYL